jgi:hypothetical protein
VDAREEMWNGRKQEDVLREIRGVAAVSTKEESKEEDIVASKGKEEKKSGFFKRFVNRGRAALPLAGANKDEDEIKNEDKDNDEDENKDEDT